MKFPGQKNEGSDRHYSHSNSSAANRVTVADVADFHNVDRVLYTRISANIPNPTPQVLARLAITRAAGNAGVSGKDGMSYLMSLKSQAIETPLMAAYEAEILKY